PQSPRSGGRSAPRKAKPNGVAAEIAKVAPGPGPRAATATGDSTVVAGFEFHELRRLIRLVQKTGIGELELSSNGRSIRISANAVAGATASVPPPAPIPAASTVAPAPSAPPPVATGKPITSPMVGTFYRSPAPDADPFVEVGDVVEVGQTVC